MDKKQKGGNATPETQHKGNHFSTTYQVLEILKSGQKVTAVALNKTLGFNNGRKAISLLRGQDYPINDFRLPDRRKVYYLPVDWKRIMIEGKPSDQQLEVFAL
jgi:hypothetical protein